MCDGSTKSYLDITNHDYGYNKGRSYQSQAIVKLPAWNRHRYALFLVRTLQLCPTRLGPPQCACPEEYDSALVGLKLPTLYNQLDCSPYFQHPLCYFLCPLLLFCESLRSFRLRNLSATYLSVSVGRGPRAAICLTSHRPTDLCFFLTTFSRNGQDLARS